MSRAQSLVEFALIAPILIVLSMAAWDGGSALREQVVLQQAARDGARAGATAYGGAQQSVIRDAVLASASDLPALATTSGSISISSDAQSISVRVQYAHALITPVLRQMWGAGNGTLTLSASSTFYVPRQTPVPATIVPSTPIPSPTPTLTATPTLTPTATLAQTPTPSMTPTATPVLPNACTVIPNATPLPSLGNNTGYWCTLRLSTAAYILAYWLDNDNPNNELRIYFNTPLSGSDPSGASPPGGAIGVMYRSDLGFLWSSSNGCLQPGTYTIYFFNRGVRIDATTGNVSTYAC